MSAAFRVPVRPAAVAAMVSAWSILLVVILLGARAPDVPPGLESFLHARTGLQTGYVVWSTRFNGEPDGVTGNYRWHSLQVPRYFASRFGPSEYMVEDHGDPDGVVFRGPGGKPDPDLGYCPMRYLYYGDAQWEMREDDVYANVYGEHEGLIDVRLLGAVPGLCMGTASPRWAEALRTAERYEVKRAGELVEVTAHLPKGMTTRYLLDPRAGWNPVSAAVLNSAGEVVEESRSKYRKWGDVWFPEEVELYERGFREGREPLYVFTVLSADFNHPDQPRHFTPEDIGVDAGMTLEVFEKGNIFRPARREGWDGQERVPFDEVGRRMRAGELKRGPRLERALLRATALGLWVDEALSRWERYVQAFIARYQLNAEQSDRAWAILRDCQDRAQQYLRKNREAIEECRAAVRRLNDPTKPRNEDTTKRLRELNARMLRLEAPVREIEIGQLLPRLERLPTRAQRAAAQAATRPAEEKKGGP